MTERISRITVREDITRHYEILLSGCIDEIEDYADELQVLASATELDTVTVKLETPGGRLDTGLALSRALRQTAAYTKAVIGFECASAGTMIALACDGWEIDENSSFMVHTASYGPPAGKQAEVWAYVKHYDKMLTRVITNTYRGFLTEDEIGRVLEGLDVYFEGEDLANRLSAYMDYREELEKQLDEAEETE